MIFKDGSQKFREGWARSGDCEEGQLSGGCVVGEGGGGF